MEAPAPEETDKCSYCTTTKTDEQLHACISYDTTCRDKEWHEFPAWVKNSEPKCGKLLHLSCARENEANKEAYGGDTDLMGTAKYQAIGFCAGCFTEMEANRGDN